MQAVEQGDGDPRLYWGEIKTLKQKKGWGYVA
jgi:hypothetical protein